MELFTSSINQIIKSIDWKLILTIIQGSISFFIVLWLKNLLISYYSWLKFKNSMHVCLGTWIRMPTSNGHVDGQIQSANMQFIEINTKKTRIIIPTKTFPERDWVLLKKDALLSHDEEMKQIKSLHDTNLSETVMTKEED